MCVWHFAFRIVAIDGPVSFRDRLVLLRMEIDLRYRSWPLRDVRYAYPTWQVSSLSDLVWLTVASRPRFLDSMASPLCSTCWLTCSSSWFGITRRIWRWRRKRSKSLSLRFWSNRRRKKWKKWTWKTRRRKTEKLCKMEPQLMASKVRIHLLERCKMWRRKSWRVFWVRIEWNFLCSFFVAYLGHIPLSISLWLIAIDFRGL